MPANATIRKTTGSQSMSCHRQVPHHITAPGGDLGQQRIGQRLVNFIYPPCLLLALRQMPICQL